MQLVVQQNKKSNLIALIKNVDFNSQTARK